MPLTSIIIPTHDRPHFLPRAVESARRAGSAVEVVVVDDGSVDETQTVCAATPDITYVRIDRQRGVGHARNAGIAASSGAYLAFLDDDDVRLPGSIDRQVAVLESSPATAMVYAPVFRGAQDLSITDRICPTVCPSGDIFWQLMARNFIPAIAPVFRRSVIDEVGGPREECAPADDWDLWLRITERHRVAALDEPVAIWREPTLWSNQGSSRFAERLLPAAARVIERSAALSRVATNPAAVRRARRERLRDMCDRLLLDTVQAARQRDLYAFVSLAGALRIAPGALIRSFLARRSWKHLWLSVARS